MANKEIADLTDAGTLDGTESVHVVKSGNSRKTTAGDVSRSGLGAVDADIVPDTDSSRDLGDATKAWALAYLDAIEAVGSDTTIKRVGGTNATSIIASLIKTWLTFNGTGTPSISDDYNVTSLTDSNVGYYIATFANDFSAGDYAVAGSVRHISGYGVAQVPVLGVANASAPQSGSCDIQTSAVGDGGARANIDSAYVSAIFLGQLA